MEWNRSRPPGLILYEYVEFSRFLCGSCLIKEKYAISSSWNFLLYFDSFFWSVTYIVR
jgi:hypothetical protein